METYIVSYAMKENGSEMESKIMKGYRNKKDACLYIREESLKLITREGFFVSSGAITMNKDYIELSSIKTDDDQTGFKATYSIEPVFIEDERQKKERTGFLSTINNYTEEIIKTLYITVMSISVLSLIAFLILWNPIFLIISTIGVVSIMIGILVLFGPDIMH